MDTPKRIERMLMTLVLALAPLAAANATVLKIATISPDGTSWMTRMRAGAAEVEQRTHGRVQFKFYPGGIMGNDQSVLRKIHAGQLQGGAVSGGSLAGIGAEAALAVALVKRARDLALGLPILAWWQLEELRSVMRRR